jgi:hypothetical protein
MVAAAMLGSSALSAGASFLGSSKASKQQADMQRQALAQQAKMFGIAQDAVTPFANAGAGMIPILQQLLTPGANQTATLSQLPGFQFAQDWGTKAVRNLGTMRGMGGNVLKAGADYATGTAQQGFAGLVNMIQQMMSTGAGAASSLGGMAANFANMGSNAFTNMGNAQAAGTMGGANAIGGFGNSIGNMAMMDKFTGGGLFGGGGGGGMYGNNAQMPSSAFMNNQWGW